MRNSVPLKGKRYMNEQTADFMVDTAVKPHKLPFCGHRAATHVAGCSAAGLVARAMRANLNFFRDQVDICWMELMHERDFGLTKLQEHIDILGALNLLLFTITADRVSTSAKGSSDEDSETVNILTQAFAKLPQEDLQIYNEGIIRLRHTLEDEILLEMMALRDEIKEDQKKDWQEDIKLLLHIRVGPRLMEMFDDLVELSENIGSVVENVRADFKANVRQLKDDGHD